MGGRSRRGRRRRGAGRRPATRGWCGSSASPATASASPRCTAAACERFDFDSVLLPCNHSLLQQPDYRADFDALVEECRARHVAVQTIKAVARRRWPADSDEPRYAWYQPLPPGPALERAVAFVLGRARAVPEHVERRPPARRRRAAASGPIAAPREAELDADVADHDMAPLFDGRELERIWRPGPHTLGRRGLGPAIPRSARPETAQPARDARHTGPHRVQAGTEHHEATDHQDRREDRDQADANADASSAVETMARPRRLSSC